MEMIIKLVTYAIIMTIVGVVVSKVNAENKNIKITKEGLETKISMLYSNSHLLKELLKSKIK